MARRQLSRKADNIDNVQGVILAIWLVERLIGRFALFSAETGHAGTSELYSAVYQVWRNLEGNAQPGNVGSDDCYRVAPDSEDYNSVFASSAIDAANAAGVLLEFQKDGDKQQLRDIIGLYLDSVDILIQLREVPDVYGDQLEECIASSEMMVRTVDMLHDFLDRAKGIPPGPERFRSFLMETLEVRRRYPGSEYEQ